MSDGMIIFLLIIAIALAIFSIILTVDFGKVISAGAGVNKEGAASANIGLVIQEGGIIANG